MQDIRIFARLGDGTLRRAVRYSDTPGWIWMYEGSGPLRRLGDIVVCAATEAALPQSASAFADAFGITLVS